jgi:hypothetical protein
LRGLDANNNKKKKNGMNVSVKRYRQKKKKESKLPSNSMPISDRERMMFVDALQSTPAAGVH